MKTIFTILIVLGCFIAYFVICGLISVFIQKHALTIDEIGRGIIAALWPLTFTFILPFIIIDFVRSRFGLETDLFEFKK